MSVAAALRHTQRTLVHIGAALRPPIGRHRLQVAAARVRTAAIATGARLAPETGHQIVAAHQRIARLVQVALVNVVAVRAVAGEAERTGGTAVERGRRVGGAFDTCVGAG